MLSHFLAVAYAHVAAPVAATQHYTIPAPVTYTQATATHVAAPVSYAHATATHVVAPQHYTVAAPVTYAHTTAAHTPVAYTSPHTGYAGYPYAAYPYATVATAPAA